MVQLCINSLTGSREIFFKTIVAVFSAFLLNKNPDFSENVSWSGGKTAEINSV